jgi:biofilm PGA synthesis N-glycosyltransferase PgaC
VLISRCRNEAAYLTQTLDPVIGQSDQRANWVINDDDSTDGTPQILPENRVKQDWIEVVSRRDRGRRVVERMMTNRHPADTDGTRADRTQALGAGMMA